MPLTDQRALRAYLERRLDCLQSLLARTSGAGLIARRLGAEAAQVGVLLLGLPALAPVMYTAPDEERA